MRIFFITASAISLSLISCKKNTEGNGNVIIKESAETSYTDNNGKIDSATSASYEKTADGKTNRQETFIYSGLDNTKAKVTFADTPEEHTLTIEANKRKIQLDRKDVNPLKTTYERNGIRAEKKGDSLYIIQDGNIIPLKKDNI